ncbi:MAG: DUF1761 domain-containing protein [Phycisphaerales bacterium]
MQIHLDQVNWLAVPVAAVAAFVIGGVVYGAIFGKKWVTLHGYDNEAATARMRQSQGKAFALMFAADLLMAAVIAVILTALSDVTWMTGAGVGLLMWAGAALPDQIMQNAAHRKPVAAFAIDTVHALLYLVASGAILGAWR